jgi:LmbE family N-acetylglucosaminyl deacetylase
MAHPDDIEFSCAGTLARWVKAGCRVGYVLCTSGEVGIAEPGMTRELAARIRESEALEAAAIMGVRDVVFLREPDGLLEATLSLREKLVREIRSFQPEVVVVGDPTIVWAGQDYINHPDHRAAAQAALDATFPAAGQPNLFEDQIQQGLSICKPRKVYATTWGSSDLYVDITDTIDIKISALMAHKSQMKGWDPGPMVRQWAEEAAQGREMTYAEYFRVVTLVDDESWQKIILEKAR